MTRCPARPGAVAAAAAALALLAAGCGSSDEATRPGVRPTSVAPSPGASGSPTPTEAEPSATPAGDPVSVVASTDVYGSIASTVGGSDVEVTSIIDDDGADPLEYESTPADAAAVSAAQVVILNGNGYDEFMPQLVDAAGGDKTVLDVSELSGLKPAAEAAGEEFNEHMWYDLETVQKLATTLATDLAEVRPEAAQTFAANATAFNAEVDALKARLKDISATNAGGRIAVTEPLANYLLIDAGLENVAPEEFQEAIEEGTDPPAAVLQEMLTLFTGDPAEVLILNTQTQSAVTDQVVQAAEAAGVPVVRMSETLTAEGYLTWMGGQVDALATALGD